MIASAPPGSPGNRRRWRSIEAAAVAGLLHSTLSLVATFLMLDTVDPDDGDVVVADYLSEAGNQAQAITALNLLALSSIAFVWFVAVIRRRVGDRENRFFGTVFFGSGLLLTASWLVAGVLFTTPAFAVRTFDVTPDAGTVAMLESAGLSMASIVATRLEAVFVLSATTVGRLSKAFPAWLLWLRYGLGATLLLYPVPNALLTYLFPLWVLLVSLTLLVRKATIERATA